MEPIEFPEQTVIIAKDQPQYKPLPAKLCKDKEGTIVTCWDISDEELAILLQTKKVYLQLLTFNNPIQPLYLTVKKEEVL